MSTELLETVRRQVDERMLEVNALRSLLTNPVVSPRVWVAIQRLVDELMVDVDALRSLHASVVAAMDIKALGLPAPPNFTTESDWTVRTRRRSNRRGKEQDGRSE